MDRKAILILVTLVLSLALSACGNGSGSGGGAPVGRNQVVFDVDYGAPGGINGVGGEFVKFQETIFTSSPGGSCTSYKLSADTVSTGCANGACNVCPLNYSPPFGWTRSNVMIIERLVDGDYTLQVRGIKDCSGTLEVCFEDNTSSFSVSGERSLDLGTILVPPKACSC